MLRHQLAWLVLQPQRLHRNHENGRLPPSWLKWYACDLDRFHIAPTLDQARCGEQTAELNNNVSKALIEPIDPGRILKGIREATGLASQIVCIGLVTANALSGQETTLAAQIHNATKAAVRALRVFPVKATEPDDAYDDFPS